MTPQTTPFSMEDFIQALEAQNQEFKTGDIVRGKVFSYETNGIFVDIGAKSLAFVPAYELSPQEEIDPSELVPLNSEQDFLIIREENEDGQLTLSLKQITTKLAWEKLENLQANGQSLMVKVKELNKGGLLVDAEGLRGFVPKSQVLDQQNIQHLIGQNITVSIIEINLETKRIILSEKQAAKAKALSSLGIGQLVEGRITNIKPYGLFLNLDGITGLLHIKQITEGNSQAILSNFELGQTLKAIVINIDNTEGKISLSTKVLENYPGEMLQNREEIMLNAEERAKNASNKITA
jgi:small subunit ribosomal protein S1